MIFFGSSSASLSLPSFPLSALTFPPPLCSFFLSFFRKPNQFSCLVTCHGTRSQCQCWWLPQKQSQARGRSKAKGAVGKVTSCAAGQWKQSLTFKWSNGNEISTWSSLYLPLCSGFLADWRLWPFGDVIADTPPHPSHCSRLPLPPNEP